MMLKTLNSNFLDRKDTLKIRCFDTNTIKNTKVTKSVVIGVGTDVPDRKARVTTIAGPNSVRHYSNNMVFCFIENETFCLNKMAGQIVKCSLHH